MRILLVITLSILVLSGCQEPTGRSEAFFQSYYRGLDLLERYRLRAAEHALLHIASGWNLTLPRGTGS